MMRNKLQSRTIVIAVLFGVGIVAMYATGQDSGPNIVLINGKIFTSNASKPYVQALAILGERIVATGDSAKIKSLAQPRTKVIDLGGRSVIPGINDVHQHIAINDVLRHIEILPPGVVQLELNTQDPTWNQLKESIVDAASKTPKGTFILASIGPRIFHDPSMARESLDHITPNHPVILCTASGHAAILNSAALAKAGISENQKDPAGGKYERSGNGKLTGVLREYALWSVLRTLGLMPSDAEALAQLQAFFEQSVKFGITTVQDISGGIETGRAVMLLEKAQTPIRIRVIRMPMTTPAGRNTKEGLSVPRHPSSLISVNGTKWFVDGVPIENTFTPRDVPSLPKGELPDYAFLHLPLIFPEEEILAMLRESLADNDPIVFHITGYPGAKATLEAMQATGGKAVWAGKRVRFEHGDGVFPELIPRAKEMGIILTQNPTHFDLSVLFGPTPLKSEKAQLLRSLIESGIPVALGSDGPMNPYLNIMLACVHPSNPPEAISREQAVIAYTLTSAYAEFQETEKGSLEPGKLADLAVLSQDIFSVPLSEMPKTESVLTLVGGKVVYDAKSVVAQNAAGSQ
jgi:predicted amidohydrolase YtcJ